MLTPQGSYTIRLLDRRTGKVRRTVKANTLTANGRALAVAAMTSPRALVLNRSQRPPGAAFFAWRCTAFEAASFMTPRNLVGPMRAQVTVDADGTPISTPGFVIPDAAPDAGVPVRMRWYEASTDAYSVFGLRVDSPLAPDGTQVEPAEVSSAELMVGLAKAETDILVVDWTLALAQSGDGAGGETGLGLLRRAAGFDAAGWAVDIVRAGPLPDGVSEQEATLAFSAMGAALEVQIQHPNQVGGPSSRIVGFDLRIGAVQTVASYRFSAGDPLIPEPGTGASVEWGVTFTVGQRSSETLGVAAVPGGVRLHGDNLYSQDVEVTALGGSGSWGTPSVASSDGRVDASVASGSGPSWTVRISTDARAIFPARVTFTVSRGSGNDELSGTVRIPVAVIAP